MTELNYLVNILGSPCFKWKTRFQLFHVVSPYQTQSRVLPVIPILRYADRKTERYALIEKDRKNVKPWHVVR